MESTRLKLSLSELEDGPLKVIIEHLRDEVCLVSVLDSLASTLSSSSHEELSCSSFRELLQTLGIVLCSISKAPSTGDQTFAVCEKLRDICTCTLKEIMNGKDQCIPVVCDILSKVVRVLHSDCGANKIKYIVQECIEETVKVLETSAITYEDKKCLSPELVKLNINLKIMEAVIVGLSSQSSERTSCNEAGCLDPYSLFDSKLLDLFFKITGSGNEILTAQVLLCVLPKYVALTGNKFVLSRLWDQITCMFYSRECSQTFTKSECNSPIVTKSTSQIFLILCILANDFIPCDNEDACHSFTVTSSRTFWEILQYGLPSEDPLMRKQALYLLKRAIDSEAQKKFSKSTNTELFWWNSEKLQDFQKAWNDFFLLLEVLEEKQIHLIKPVEPVLYSLIEVGKQSVLHHSWILCAIQRALKHECNAVVKWGINCLLNLDLTLYIVQCDNYGYFLTSFMNALNSSFLYVKRKATSSPPELVEGLKSYFIAVANYEHHVRCKFFKVLLCSLLKVSWGPIPLFYVTFSLSTVPKIPVWNAKDIHLFEKFLVDTLSTQIVHIRGAIQSFSISTLAQLSSNTEIDVWTVAKILGIFKRKESLRRGTQEWLVTVKWLKSCISTEDAVLFSCTSVQSVLSGNKLKCDKLSVARMIILLSDADLISFENCEENCDSLYSLLLTVTTYFEICHSRLYVNHTRQDECFELLMLLLEESRSESMECDPTAKCIRTLVQRVLPGLFYCIRKKMVSCNLHCYDTISMYEHSLYVLSNEFLSLSAFHKEVEIIQESSLSVVKDDCDSQNPVSKYFAVKNLLWVSDFVRSYVSKNNSHLNFTKNLLFKRYVESVEYICSSQMLNMLLVKEKTSENVTRDLQTLWGKIVSDNLLTKWSILNAAFEMLDSKSAPCIASVDDIFGGALEAMEIGGRGVFVPVMAVMQKLLPHFITTKTGDVLRFMRMCWTAIFELRKSELFWISMDRFVEMSFQEEIMKNENMQDELLMYTQKILGQGESISGLSNILVKQLRAVALHGGASHLKNFIRVIVDILLFGPVHRRDQKIDYEACEFVKSLEERCCINNTHYCTGSDIEVRALGIHLLLIMRDSASCDVLLVSLTRILMEKDREASQRKARYFADSYHHRFKQRIMQALLLIEPSLPQEDCHNLMCYLRDSLLSENHQPSIRYFQEWLLTRLILRNGTHHVWPMFHVASERRPGSLCSFISIIYHIAQVLRCGNELEAFVDHAMEQILPWSMGQHFSIRLYAQVVLSKLWELSIEMNLSSIVNKYSVMQSCVKASLQSTGALKNAEKVMNDFYFNAFHPLYNYSLKTIFWDLPRLSAVTPEEWISIDVFVSIGLSTSTIPLCEESSKLSNFSCSVAHSLSGERDEDDLDRKEFSNIQKKIIPWKAMIPDPELLLSVSESVLKRKRNCDDGLIVVASLIDRPPNLGGLSRTCEVFGVSQYILGNLKVLEDKQFQTLSVTAERWISISEVRPHELPLYLKSMKMKGYTVVGAEQTAGSIQLHEMKFPKRTILLLGNEKEGIPVDLLHLLDVCVEVPQQGVVRSLNVHVTGAIFIWEYVRQHFF